MKAIYPAIDLINGQVVRLKEGDFARKTSYSDDPVAMAKGFQDEGASLLHVVDLDGAKDGKARQTKLISQIAQSTNLALQVGGGIRSLDDAKKLIDAGVDRVVIGSLAVKDPEAFIKIAEAVGPERLTLGLDCHLTESGEAMVAASGWQETSKVSADDLLGRYTSLGVKRVLCTDIKKDGMLAGPNFELYEKLSAKYPDLEFLASGGVSGKEDVTKLAKTGAFGVIIGKALYEGRLQLKEVL